LAFALSYSEFSVRSYAPSIVVNFKDRLNQNAQKDANVSLNLVRHLNIVLTTLKFSTGRKHRRPSDQKYCSIQNATKRIEIIFFRVV